MTRLSASARSCSTTQEQRRARSKPMPKPAPQPPDPRCERLCAILLRNRAVSSVALAKAREQVQDGSTGALLAHLLWETGVPEPTLLASLAELEGVSAADLARSRLELSALALLPEGLAEEEGVLPLRLGPAGLEVASASDDLQGVAERLGLLTGYTIQMHPALPERLAFVLRAAKKARGSGAVYLRGPAAKDGAGLVLVEAACEEQRSAA
jgi:hypothetical protein